MRVFSVVAIIAVLIWTTFATGCTSPIYCEGRFLERFQLRRVTNDSKTFVDRPLKASVDQVLNAFEQIPVSAPQSAYKAFMDLWMHPEGYEVQDVVPVDWVEEPSFLKQLPPNLFEFGKSLHSKWRSLVRSFNVTGLCEGCYSSIPVPHPFVVAGGRFREYYYWDSYWAVQGLLVSGMNTTAKHVVDNLLYLVDKYGFVPNGGRIYYLSRSQPPLLTLMVKMLFEHTQDVEWLRSAVRTLEKEMDWWLDKRRVDRTNGYLEYFAVLHYDSDTILPRPESYREDIATAGLLPHTERGFCYRELTAGAESGWDFSSRWLQDWNRLSSIQTSQVIPVDLNSIYFLVEATLSNMLNLLGDHANASKHELRANKMFGSLKNYFWSDVAQTWYDHGYSNSGTPFYVSNIMPIWAKGYHQTPEEALAIIKRIWPQVMFPGGVPTSLIYSKQQWDFPNAWAPLQQFLIDALDGLDLPEATQMADKLAITWFNSNYCAWSATLSQGGLFFEKYDVTNPGFAGGGGEYQVQTGFGWTNGVLLKLLKTRGHLFSVLPQCETSPWN